MLLGDGKTTLSIKGAGTIKCKIGDHILTVPNVRYIPDLSESIYSLFVHMQTPNYGLESSYEDGLFLKFPHFTTIAVIGGDDIYVDMLPIHSSTTGIQDADLISDTLSFCHHLTQLTGDVDQETKQLDNILRDLR